ncbi:hypothetical protein PICSAR16_04409 [Mycobacterium avium subsp. paratuberculosis]|nr:hypothetical protein PICSAR16_04409 [Mycobacterium avium subsp. paratuberculosis]
MPAALHCLSAVMIRFTFAIGSGSASTPAALPGAPIGATNHAVGWPSCGW